MACPNQLDSNVTQEIGIDFFLEALDNPDLERRVREKELDTLDKTFRCCFKLEAQDKAIAMRTDARRLAPHVARNVHTDAVVEQLQKQMDQLLLVQQKTETECKQLRNELKQARSASNADAAMNTPYVPPNDSMKAKEVRNRTEMNQMPVDETNETKQGNSRKSIRCYNCNRLGHISRECKSVKRTSVTEPVDTAAASSTPYIGNKDASARLNGVFDRLCTEQDVYIKVEIGNRTYNCLLDSGAQLSILPAHIVQNCNLSPSSVRLKAANNIVIPILGQIDIDLEINSLKFRKNLLVTEHVAEVMLGYDFLREHEVTWNFADSTTTLHGQTIPTCNQHETWYRKLVLTYDVKIPSCSEMNVSGNVLLRRISVVRKF